MRFTVLTGEQAAANKSAEQQLVRGKHYRFDPPVTSTAVPTGGPNACALVTCTFDRGWYVGQGEDNYVFQGRPVNDQRVIPVPQGYRDAPNLDEILDRLRESYFFVQFTGGSVASLDPDQGG